MKSEIIFLRNFSLVFLQRVSKIYDIMVIQVIGQTKIYNFVSIFYDIV